MENTLKKITKLKFFFFFFFLQKALAHNMRNVLFKSAEIVLLNWRDAI